MRGFPAKSQVLAAAPRKQDKMLLGLAELLHHLGGLSTRVSQQIAGITHAQNPESAILQHEYRQFLAEFRKLSEIAKAQRKPLEEKISSLKQKGPVCFSEPILASSLQSVVVLHMVSEQSMARRLEELAEIRKRQKDLLSQLEVGMKALRERFDDLAARMNLFLYMCDCLEKEGTLPGNIMYNAKLPQVVSSPFGVQQVAGLLKPPSFEPALQAKEIHAQHDVEDEKKELEKRRSLLLQLRQASNQAQQEEIKKQEQVKNSEMTQ